MVSVRALDWRVARHEAGRAVYWVGIVGNSTHATISLEDDGYRYAGTVYKTLVDAQEAARIQHRCYVLGLISLEH